MIANRQPNTFGFAAILLMCSLSACHDSSSTATTAEAAERPAPIQPAPKLSHDATVYAQRAYALMQSVEPMIQANNTANIEAQVRRPIRQLSTEWRINVKMTDSVTEGEFALCRKALTSLDILARATLEADQKIAEKQANYARDKTLCERALANPSLGNTDPKMGAESRRAAS